MRVRDMYRSIALRGRMRLPVTALRGLVGPDCAYHLYKYSGTEEKRLPVDLPAVHPANIYLMEDIKVNVRVDTRGQVCPIPVLKAKKAIDAMNPGEVLEVVASDPNTKADITRFIKRTGHELLKSRDEGETLHFFILKK